MLPYLICGTWRSMSVGEDFKVIIWGGKPQRDGTIFIGGVDPLRHQVKIFIWQLEEGLVG